MCECFFLYELSCIIGVHLSVYLDEDLPAELIRRGKLLCVVIDWFGEQQISEHLLKVRGHVSLLNHAAVVLDGQNHRIPTNTREEGGFFAASLMQQF